MDVVVQREQPPAIIGPCRSCLSETHQSARYENSSKQCGGTIQFSPRAICREIFRRDHPDLSVALPATEGWANPRSPPPFTGEEIVTTPV